MSRGNRTYGGHRIFVGDIGPRVGKYDLEREFDTYGSLVDVWVARNPPGFAFLVYKYREDADRAVRGLDGRICFGRRIRVEHARPYSSGGGGGRRGGGGWGGGGGGYGRDRGRYRSRLNQFSLPNHRNHATNFSAGTNPVLNMLQAGRIAVQYARGALPIIRPILRPSNQSFGGNQPVYYLAANQQPSNPYRQIFDL